MDVSENPDLSCIEVDDLLNSSGTWKHESHNSFSENCGNPCTLEIEELTSTPKVLVKIFNLQGKETEFIANTLQIYLYSDGTTEKKYQIES